MNAKERAGSLINLNGSKEKALEVLQVTIDFFNADNPTNSQKLKIVRYLEKVKEEIVKLNA